MMAESTSIRELLLSIIVGMPVLGIVNSLWFGSSLVRYLRQQPRIASFHDMEQFKRIVAAQMYGALAQILVLVLPGIAFAAGFVLKVLGRVDLLFVLVPSAVVVLVGVYYKRIERSAQTLDVSEEFREEYARVIYTWLHKPFPTW
ncbi:MAG: hypothetical protein IT364_15205 [Candidatus Hydrogenedentes bacterium]|nr:hypothetical protein [Candidatus Hydrogenedentota bacterium]